MKIVPSKMGAEYYRSFLSNQGKVFYDGIHEQLLRCDYSGITRFKIKNESTASSDCFAAYKAIRDDHPEFFYLGYQSEFTRHGINGVLKYPILYTEDIICRIQIQMRKTICNLVRDTANLSMIERELLVYERIAKKLTYVNNEDVRDHNIVGPVLLSAGVCEGHNALLMMCLRRIGIPCIKVYGKTKSDGWHCWTIAWINEEAVHCDVTWDGAQDGIVSFNYFNLSDRQIATNHFSFRGIRTPVCTCEELNYYFLHGLCAGSRKELCQIIKRENAAKLPIRLHMAYSPALGDFVKEIQHALRSSKIYDASKMYLNHELQNAVITR